jgi:hypothetical protein
MPPGFSSIARRGEEGPMTQALCFNCGETKFGAICGCPSCGVQSTGDMSLDIAFSDHHMDVETIQAFGEVVRSIRRECDDDGLRLWTFLSFVSSNHPEILQVELEPEVSARCAAVLARANPPPVVVRESWSSRRRRRRR